MKNLLLNFIPDIIGVSGETGEAVDESLKWIGDQVDKKRAAEKMLANDRMNNKKVSWMQKTFTKKSFKNIFLLD